MIVEIQEGSCKRVKRCVNTVITLPPATGAASGVTVVTTPTPKPCGVTGYITDTTKTFY
jgi:hypothetical protein